MASGATAESHQYLDALIKLTYAPDSFLLFFYYRIGEHVFYQLRRCITYSIFFSLFHSLQNIIIPSFKFLLFFSFKWICRRSTALMPMKSKDTHNIPLKIGKTKTKKCVKKKEKEKEIDNHKDTIQPY